MAVLSDSDRAIVHRDYMRAETTPFGSITKADLRAAVNGLDDYLNTNAAAINNAIPQPARNQLTTAQKALLLRFVITRRYLSGV
jgi:hypothetical protein